MGVALTGDWKKLAGAIGRMADFKTQEIQQAIGGYLDLRTQEQFDKEQSPEGEKWGALRKARNRERDKAGKKRRLKSGKEARDNRLLQDTGALARKINTKFKGDQVHHGSNLPYARRQQFGDDKGNMNPEKGIKARPYLGITPEDEKEIGRIAADVLREMVKV